MKNHLFRAFSSGCLLLAVMLCLTACGKKETAPESIVNWTLPDVASFEENYTSERETAAIISASKREAVIAIRECPVFRRSISATPFLSCCAALRLSAFLFPHTCRLGTV